jgi:hypothetical protein
MWATTSVTEAPGRSVTTSGYNGGDPSRHIHRSSTKRVASPCDRHTTSHHRALFSAAASTSPITVGDHPTSRASAHGVRRRLEAATTRARSSWRACDGPSVDRQLFARPRRCPRRVPAEVVADRRRGSQVRAPPGRRVRGFIREGRRWSGDALLPDTGVFMLSTLPLPAHSDIRRVCGIPDRRSRTDDQSVPGALLPRSACRCQVAARRAR